MKNTKFLMGLLALLTLFTACEAKKSNTSTGPSGSVRFVVNSDQSLAQFEDYLSTKISNSSNPSALPLEAQVGSIAGGDNGAACGNANPANKLDACNFNLALANIVGGCFIFGCTQNLGGYCVLAAATSCNCNVRGVTTTLNRPFADPNNPCFAVPGYIQAAQQGQASWCCSSACNTCNGTIPIMLH